MLEIVGTSVEDVKRIGESKASRIELCGDISKDGVTPELDFVKECLEVAKTPMRVMVRPEDLMVIQDGELEEMLAFIAEIKKLNHPMIDGIVIGYATEDGQMDKETTRKLVEAAKPLNVTFHKACETFIDDLTIFEDEGISTVLTQGGTTPINDNIEKLKEIAKTNDNVELLIGGGVNEDNLEQLKDISKSIHIGTLARFNKSYDEPIDIDMVNKVVDTINS